MAIRKSRSSDSIIRSSTPSIGSRRIARRPGIRQAISATATSRVTAVPSITGSVPSTRVIATGITRETATEPATPMTRPMAICHEALRVTSHQTCRAWAPSATRTPISRVRWADRVRRHRIESDRCEDQRDDGENAEHRSEDALRPPLRVDEVVHHLDVVERQIGIDGAKLLPQQRGGERWFRRRSHQHVAVPDDVVGVRDVDDRVESSVLWRALPHVLHDADNRQPLRPVAVAVRPVIRELNPLADRVGSRGSASRRSAR